jgi:hypothetical protein
MELIDQLAKLKMDRDDLLDAREHAVREIMPDHLRQQLDNIAEAFDQRLDALEKETTSLENALRDDVVARRDHIKGAKLIAFYSEGRTSWDTAGLDRYAKDHPEILLLKKQGKPFATIKTRDKQL